MSFAELVELEIGYDEFLAILDFNLERNPGIGIIDLYRSLTGESELEIKEVEYTPRQKSKKVTLKSEKELFDMINNKKQKTFNPEALEESEDLKESDIDGISIAKSLTYGYEEYNGNALKCRGCLQETIEKDSEKCPKCNTLIKWF